MIRMIWKQTLARRGRLALTVVAVMLGVTFVTGTLVLIDTAGRVFDDQFRDTTAGVDLTVRDAVAFDSAMGVEVQRAALSPRLVDRVAGVPGVRVARPEAKGTGLLEYDGQPIVPAGPSLLGSWEPRPFGPFTVRFGHAPTEPGEVVIDEATAAAHHIQVGDRITVQSKRSLPLTVVGLAGFGRQDGLTNSTVALVNLGTAQRLLGLDDRISDVLVTGDGTVPVSRLQERVAAAVGRGLEVSSSQDAATASAEAAKAQLGYLEALLLALAAAALLIGGFLIANTFGIVVSQRRRELALLRAAGATGRQVVASVLGEAVVVGVVGSLAGLAGGLCAASGLRHLLSGFGVALPSSGLVLQPRTVWVALLIGVVVTTLAALGPARRAARVSPVAALHHDETAGVSAVRRIAGWLCVLVAVGVAVLTDATTRQQGTTAVASGPSTVLVALGGVAAVLALVLLGPVFSPRLARLVGWPLRAAGVPGVMAREAAGRAPRRTAATVVALALSLSLIGFLAVVGSSVKQSLKSSYEEVLSADFVIESSRNEMLGGLVPASYDRVSRLDQVDTVARVRYGHWKDGRTVRPLTAADPATLPAVAHLHMLQGELSDLGRNELVVSQHIAREQHLRVGQQLTMTFPEAGPTRVRLVGVMEDRAAEALSTGYLISLHTYDAVYTERVDAMLLVKKAHVASTAQTRRALNHALASLPTASVRNQAAAAAARAGAVDQVMGIMTALLLFTVLIATLGITNTLALSILERTLELGLLRAVGMSRRQLRTMVRLEAVLLAALALVLGLVAGVGYGTAVVAAIAGSRGVATMLPVGQLGLLLGIATVVGLLAGAAPARRAARLDVLTAIAVE